MHFYEATLIDTIEGIQCKVYSSTHPEGKVIVKPKYIPADLLDTEGLSFKHRFVFSKDVIRFHVFTKQETVKEILKRFKARFPDYIHEDKDVNTWFFAIPKNKIKTYYDPKKGLKELLKMPENDLDPYLKATVGLIKLIMQADIKADDLGISHSTLLGNYTPGRSDIDIIVFGKKNGWKAIKFLEKAKHPLLRWKTEEDWAKYYTDRVVSRYFSKEEYVFNMVRKKDDGFFDNNVFSIFCVEEPSELWYKWGEQTHEPLGTVKLTATVTEDYNAIVRPGYYAIKNSKIIDGHEQVEVARIVNWSRPFTLQAKPGEQVECCGLLEKVTPKNKKEKPYYQVVLGYIDAYACGRGEQEYLKAKPNQEKKQR